MAAPKVQLGSRLPAEIVERVRAEAKRNRWTLSVATEVLLAEALAVRDRARRSARPKAAEAASRGRPKAKG
jgi:hypothetical protein